MTRSEPAGPTSEEVDALRSASRPLVLDRLPCPPLAPSKQVER